MKILVPIKRVIDYTVKARISAATNIQTANVKHSMNPFDEIALEEALKIRTKDSSVIAVSIGGAQSANETLRTALAMGADRAIHVPVQDENRLEVQPLEIAKLIGEIVKREGVELVLMGKQAIDDDSGQTGQMVAGLLGWSQATFAYKVECKDGKAKVVREVDGGLQTVEAPLPMVITTDLRLNQPRYATLPNIMKAKKKPIEVIDPKDLGVLVKNRLKIVELTEPPKRSGGKIVESVDELVEHIKKAL